MGVMKTKTRSYEIMLGRPHGQWELKDFKLGVRRERRIKSSRENLYHAQRNGVYDPVTYYHVLDMMLDVKPGGTFRSKDLVTELSSRRRMIMWDPVTVGRVITDIAEVLQDAYGWKCIGANRRFNGMSFDVSGHPEAREAMEKLLEDLQKVAEDEIEDERIANHPAKRTQSPLNSCPSVMDFPAIMAQK